MLAPEQLPGAATAAYCRAGSAAAERASNRGVPQQIAGRGRGVAQTAVHGSHVPPLGGGGGNHWGAEDQRRRARGIRARAQAGLLPMIAGKHIGRGLSRLRSIALARLGLDLDTGYVLKSPTRPPKGAAQGSEATTRCAASEARGGWAPQRRQHKRGRGGDAPKMGSKPERRTKTAATGTRAAARGGHRAPQREEPPAPAGASILIQ